MHCVFKNQSLLVLFFIRNRVASRAEVPQKFWAGFGDYKQKFSFFSVSSS